LLTTSVPGQPQNMTESPVLGKAGFVQVMTQFYKLFTAMRVNDQVVEEDRAYVLTNYDLAFPNEKKANIDTVEVWTVRDGKLASRTVFNNSYSIAQLMQ
jgi:ketosteroid isomerase-like protein